MKTRQSSLSDRHGISIRPSWLWVLFLIASWCGVGGLWSAPYGPRGKAVHWTQPTGEKLELRVFGDEHYARTETVDGYTVVFDPATKTYYYAALAADGESFVPTATPAGTADPATLGVPKKLSINPDAARRQALANFTKWEAGMKTRTRWSTLKAQRQAVEQPARENGPAMAPPTFTTVGNKVGLTLLIDFDNDPATVPQASIIDYCNGDNYTGYGNNGSIKQYFRDNSNNLLTYTNVVTAYIRIPNSLHPKSYYNDTSKDAGEQGNKLIKDAITIMKALPNYTTEILPTFSNLTLDSEGNVEACNVFYAGDNGGAWAQGLWPHSWNLEIVGPQSLSNGGMKVNKYQITDIGDGLAIGTFCHENGHMLCGYPDIYDYGYDSTGGAGNFCLMNSGGNDSDHNPAMICAYLKYASGWATVSNITSTKRMTATMHSSPGQEYYNHFYRLEKPGTRTEYFLIENRNQSGRDAGIPDSGIAVWHVDELGDHNEQSLLANTTHTNYEVTLVQADGQWHFQQVPWDGGNSGDANDLYSNGRTLTDNTLPSAVWWNGGMSGLNMNTFSDPGTVMTFLFGAKMDDNSIIMVNPNGGEERYHGSTYPVSWNTNVPGNVTVELFKGGTLVEVLADSIPNTGEFVWVPSADLTPGNDYRVRVTSLTNLAWFGQSAGTFSVIAAAPTITSPLVAQGVINQPFTYQITANNNGTNLGASGLPQGLSVNGTGLITGTPTVAGTFYVTLSATNIVGTGRSTLRLIVDSATISLTEALDSPAMVWTQGGATGWQTLVNGGSNHDGVDSAQSRSLGNDEENWVETTVAGPGILTFWWSTSSEVYDKLHFTVDGIENIGPTGIPPISGTQPWVQRTKNIDAGFHTLRWTYRKDHTAIMGLDTAWLDQVEFTPVIHTPEIRVEQPLGTQLVDGLSSVSFGDVIFGSNTTKEFTIANVGSGLLNVGAITFDGANPGDFAVTIPPAATVNPGEITKFTVRFLPTVAGPRTAGMHIANNDASASPFDLILTGTVAPRQEYPGGNIKAPVVGKTDGPSDPYPSTANVVGVSGTVLAVKLKLNGFYHGYCDDIDMYLLAPNGKFCTIMSDAAGPAISSASPRNLVFEDAAPTKIQDASLSVSTNNFRPADYANAGGTANPSQYDYNRPAGTEVFTLNELAAGSANGDWKLYVHDDTSGSRGEIGSWALVIETASPEIVVEQPAGTPLVDGAASIALGSVNYGSSSATQTVTVKNTGTGELGGLAVTIDGAAATDFTVGALGATTLAAGASTTFTVAFTPSALGERTAAIHIASTDTDENPFDINLTGTGVGTSIQAWRQANFGSPANSGDGADLNDYEKDGIVNLIEFAFGLDPKQNSAGKLPTPELVGGNLVTTFNQPAGVSGVTYGAEWSETMLPGSWVAIPDTGVEPGHRFSVPTGSKTKLFTRLKVLTNP